ncbi:MAG TPA: tetratricopeptide repeat protein, partial [Steroidobacteraceae bacterium]
MSRPALALAGGLVLLAGALGPGWAQDRTRRKADAPAPTVGDLQRGAASAIQVHPDATLNGSAAKAMQGYSEFLKLQNSDANLRAQALRRLGDLNLESGELERMSNEVSQLDTPGAEAIRLYSILLKAYPDYARNDQVLYQLARAYETTGQSDTALATLDRIVAHYPGAREIAEVHFRRGELLFSAKRYPEAQSAYEKVIARGAGGSSFYEQSLYKHGWSLFKQSQNQACLQSFLKLLDRTL